MVYNTVRLSSSGTGVYYTLQRRSDDNGGGGGDRWWTRDPLTAIKDKTNIYGGQTRY